MFSYTDLQKPAGIRQRKLNTRNGLGIVREDELEPIDDELQRNVPRIDTGIEKAEEQRVIPIPSALSLCCFQFSRSQVFQRSSSFSLFRDHPSTSPNINEQGAPLASRTVSFTSSCHRW